jgi:hypothetical protein
MLKIIPEDELTKAVAMCDFSVLKEYQYDFDLMHVDQSYSGALKKYLFLTHHEIFTDFTGFLSEYSEGDIAVSRYLWFKLFCQLYFAKNGYDAGIDQILIQLLEQIGNTNPNFDWNLILEIEEIVSRYS